MLRSVMFQFACVVLTTYLSTGDAAAGSFTVSPSIGELGAGITVTYTLEDYTPYLYDIIAIYASGEVSILHLGSIIPKLF